MPEASSEGGATHPDIGDVRIQDVVGIKEQTVARDGWSRARPFWVTVALLIIIVADELSCSPMPSPRATNFYNITRNFAFIGIMALGMVDGDRHRRHRPVGRLDHGTGRRGLRPHPARRTMHWCVAVVAGLLAGMAAGAVNGAADRLCRPVALRRHARHAVVRALGGDRAVAEPDDLQVRPRRTGLQGDRRRANFLRQCRSLRIRSGCWSSWRSSSA